MKTIAAIVKLSIEVTGNPQLNCADRFLVERDGLPTGAIEVFYAIVPFSGYHL